MVKEEREVGLQSDEERCIVHSTCLWKIKASERLGSGEKNISQTSSAAVLHPVVYRSDDEDEESDAVSCCKWMMVRIWCMGNEIGLQAGRQKKEQLHHLFDFFLPFLQTRRRRDRSQAPEQKRLKRSLFKQNSPYLFSSWDARLWLCLKHGMDCLFCRLFFLFPLPLFHSIDLRMNMIICMTTRLGEQKQDRHSGWVGSRKILLTKCHLHSVALVFDVFESGC